MVPRVSLAGWRGVWPPDRGAAVALEGATDDRGSSQAMSPSQWYPTEAVRQLLATEDLPMSGKRIAAQLGKSALDLMPRLEAAGIVQVYRVAFWSRYRLTEHGRRTLTWAGCPKQDHVPERGIFQVGNRVIIGWAAQLSSAIAVHYGATVHEMLATGVLGAPVIARARLCAALHARGWRLREIERHFGMPSGWAESGVARWRRLRSKEIER